VVYYVIISFKNVGVNLVEDIVNNAEQFRTNMRLYFSAKFAFVDVINERCNVAALDIYVMLTIYCDSITQREWIALNQLTLVCYINSPKRLKHTFYLFTI